MPPLLSSTFLLSHLWTARPQPEVERGCMHNSFFPPHFPHVPFSTPWHVNKVSSLYWISTCDGEKETVKIWLDWYNCQREEPFLDLAGVWSWPFSSWDILVAFRDLTVSLDILPIVLFIQILESFHLFWDSRIFHFSVRIKLCPPVALNRIQDNLVLPSSSFLSHKGF